MYASIDFATKTDFRRAVKQGLPFVLYSPTLGMPAVDGTVTVEGPWPKTFAPAVLPFGPQLRPRRATCSAWKARARQGHARHRGALILSWEVANAAASSEGADSSFTISRAVP